MKGNRKWKFCCLLILIFSLSFILAFQLIPRMRLLHALNEAMNRLEEYVNESPVRVIADTLGQNEDLELTLDLALTDTASSQIRCSVLTRLQKNRILLQGNLAPEKNSLAFSAYLDPNFMAISSDLLDGGYYGITYDSFREDLQNIPMLKWIVSDSQAEKWNTSIQKIKRYMEQGLNIPVALPTAFPKSVLTKMLMVLPVTMNRTDVMLDGESVPALRMVYQLHSSEIPDFLSPAFPNRAMGITAAFYLTEKNLILTDIQMLEEGNSCRLQLEANSDQPEHSLSFLYYQDGNGNQQQISADFSNQDSTSEKWYFMVGASKKDFTISRNEEEDMLTFQDQRDNSASFTFHEIENGFILNSSSLSELMTITGIDIPTFSGNGLGCRMRVEKGASFKTPAYRNLDQWSFEDFLTLLDGISTHLNWKIA